MEAGAAESDWLDLHSEFRPATATNPATNKQTQKPKIKKPEPTNQTQKRYQGVGEAAHYGKSTFT